MVTRGKSRGFVAIISVRMGNNVVIKNTKLQITKNTLNLPL